MAHHRLVRLLLAGAAVGVLAASAGCGHGVGSPGPGAAGSHAPAAPIKIPAKTLDQGRPLSDLQAKIEAGIRDQCGGDLCVTLRVEYRDPDFTRCAFVKTVPGQGSRVERGSIVVIVAGTNPCSDVSSAEPGDGGDQGSAPDQ